MRGCFVRTQRNYVLYLPEQDKTCTRSAYRNPRSARLAYVTGTTGISDYMGLA